MSEADRVRHDESADIVDKSVWGGIGGQVGAKLGKEAFKKLASTMGAKASAEAGVEAGIEAGVEAGVAGVEDAAFTAADAAVASTVFDIIGSGFGLFGLAFGAAQFIEMAMSGRDAAREAGEEAYRLEDKRLHFGVATQPPIYAGKPGDEVLENEISPLFLRQWLDISNVLKGGAQIGWIKKLYDDFRSVDVFHLQRGYRHYGLDGQFKYDDLPSASVIQGILRYISMMGEFLYRRSPQVGYIRGIGYDKNASDFVSRHDIDDMITETIARVGGFRGMSDAAELLAERVDGLGLTDEFESGLWMITG